MTPERNHWARVVMYDAARAALAPIAADLDVLEVSGLAFEDLCAWKSYQSSAIDICAKPGKFWEQTYDLIVLDQVLEHVKTPAAALDSCFKVLRPGGRLFVSTPFLIRPHPSPDDFWRFTETGLQRVLATAGFRELATGAWGNRACMLANLDGWWPYDPEQHSLANELDCPVTVWAIGRRPR